MPLSDIVTDCKSSFRDILQNDIANGPRRLPVKFRSSASLNYSFDRVYLSFFFVSLSGYCGHSAVVGAVCFRWLPRKQHEIAASPALLRLWPTDQGSFYALYKRCVLA